MILSHFLFHSRWFEWAYVYRKFRFIQASIGAPNLVGIYHDALRYFHDIGNIEMSDQRYDPMNMWDWAKLHDLLMKIRQREHKQLQRIFFTVRTKLSSPLTTIFSCPWDDYYYWFFFSFLAFYLTVSITQYFSMFIFMLNALCSADSDTLH